MNALAVAMLACSVAAAAIVVMFAALVLAFRWRRVANERREMFERAQRMAHGGPPRNTVFDFVGPIRRSVALEILLGYPFPERLDEPLDEPTVDG